MKKQKVYYNPEENELLIYIGSKLNRHGVIIHRYYFGMIGDQNLMYLSLKDPKEFVYVGEL